MSRRARLCSGRRLLARASVAVVLGASPLFAGCDSLEPIAADVCGNGVVEESHSEDCDCLDAAGTCGDTSVARCIQAGDENECRYACDPEATNTGCPGGRGCGADGVCREPTGSFRSPGVSVPLSAQALFDGDFDGDGHGDLMAVGNSTLEVFYYDEEGALTTRLSIPSLGDLPAVENIDGPQKDGTDDFVFSLGQGVAILRGQPERTFSPVPASSQTFPWDLLEMEDLQLTVAGARVLPVGSTTQDQLSWVAAVFGTAPNGNETTEAFALFHGATNQLPRVLGRPIYRSRLAGPPAHANLWNGPLEEVVIAFENDTVVHVYSPDVEAPDNAHTTIELDGARVESAPFLVDVDGDQQLDLLVGASCGLPMEDEPCFELYAAIKGVDGTYPKLTRYGRISLNDSPRPGGSLGNSRPLALGDLDGDGLLDIVTENGVGRGTTSAAPPYVIDLQPIPTTSAHNWTEARIVDLNGNGVPDVIAGSSVATDLTFLNGVQSDPPVPGGFQLNEFTIPTRGGVSSFALGDFDGDLLLDLAFAESAGDAVSTQGAQALSVCFGRFLQAPAPPVRMGEFNDLLDVTPIDLPKPPDAIADIGVVFLLKEPTGEKENVALSLISGTSSRLLLPAFPLGKPPNESDLPPLRNFIGRFRTKDQLDVASLAFGALPPVGPNSKASFDLWLLPTEGTGGILIAEEESNPILEPHLPEASLIDDFDGIVADLDRAGPDNDGKDELILSWPLPNDAQGVSRGEVVIARSDEIGHFTLPEEPGVGETAAERTSTLYKRLRAGDLNEDGAIDIVAIASDRQPRTRRVTASRLVIFWNEGGKLSNAIAPLSELGDALELDNADLDDLTTATTSADFVNVDPADDGDELDASKELVVLTRDKAYVVDFCRDGVGDRCVGAEGRKLRLRKPLRDIPGGSLVKTCDVQGDGVDDLAVLKDGALRVYQGVPKHP